MDSFVGLNAQVLGISVDHIPCLSAWAESLGGINYPLLSDFWPHGTAARLYNVLRENEGFTERAIFVIDKKGYIRYIDIHDIADRPDNEVLRKVLREIEAAQSPSSAAIASALSGGSTGIYFDEPDEYAVPEGEIILYCARWCKDCRKAKAWLDERGLTYVEVDIDYNMNARSMVRKWGGGFLVTPVIDFAGSLILDYDAPRLEEAFRKYKGG